MKITIDLDTIKVAQDESGKIIMTPEAEGSILQLMDIQLQIEDAIRKAKENIEKEALKYNENFSSIVSNNLKIGYRAFGAKYTLDESRIDEVPEGLYKKEVKTVYSVDTKAVDSYCEEKGGLPLGIEERERKKQITISLKTSPDEPE